MGRAPALGKSSDQGRRFGVHGAGCRVQGAGFKLEGEARTLGFEEQLPLGTGARTRPPVPCVETFCQNTFAFKIFSLFEYVTSEMH